MEVNLIGGRPNILNIFETYFWIIFLDHNPWRIHMYAIYGNMTGVYWWDPWHTIYGSTKVAKVALAFFCRLAKR